MESYQRKASILASMTHRLTKEVMIIRHAESVANEKGLLAGRIDPTPLTATGRAQAKALNGVIKDFEPDRVISSPLLRCRQTAEWAGIAELQLDERIQEMDYGSWSGRKLDRLSKQAQWSKIQKNPEGFQFPEGESFISALMRIRDFMSDLLEGSATKIVLFTHGDISRIMINDALNRPLNDFQQLMIQPASHSRLTMQIDAKRERSNLFLHYLNRREVSERSKRSGFVLGGER